MTFLNPRIRVRPARLEEKQAVVDIFYSAFGNDVMNRLMFPAGPTPSGKEKFGDRTFAELEPGKGELMVLVAEYFSPETHPTFDPDTYPDDGSGELVAFAKWIFQKDPRPEEEWKADEFVYTVETSGEGCDLDVMNAFLGDINRKQRDSARGEPAAYLHILACRPDRQRIGAGSALVKFGIDLADSLNLPCRLEASPVGYSVYKRLGFKDVDVQDLNVTERWGVKRGADEYWGHNNALELAGPVPEGAQRTVIMRRPPKA
ncbi:hypothetical protein QBC42DRAFT_73093 [Cladorrhinum samala]|uniref:N-acetyltransferase domain-containing protein n=1 Tax=Cladorrhinum samala TaxID=585594 RepID=A0AAV9HTZ5_9PEZI|nr:hypothetical protein QBC42DRAFT_73093 [Cladorrhinum samala]